VKRKPKSVSASRKEEVLRIEWEDGLWGVVPDPQIKHVVNDAPHPQIACEQLVQAANHAGGPDNISVVIVRFPSE
jgi:serine/threonine protein phosphatase PrpC